MIKVIIISVILIIIGFVWWRYTSVKRGARKRDEKIIEKLAIIENKLENNKDVQKDEIKKAAKFPENRPLLYEMLEHFNKSDLFPEEYKLREAEAESDLAYWLCHPNELQKSPDEIELVEKVSHEIEGKTAEFYVFKFKTAPPHWAAEDGWMIGVAGPYSEDSVLYSRAPGTFSTFEKAGDKTATEMVDWVKKNILG